MGNPSLARAFRSKRMSASNIFRSLLCGSVVATALVANWEFWGHGAFRSWRESRASAGSTGFVARTFLDDRQQRRNMLVFVPQVEPPHRGYPALLFLNGHGENGDDGFDQLSNTGGRAFWELSESLPIVIIAPQCPEKESWTGDAENIAISALDFAISEYPIDETRVALTGVSSGGAGAIHLATAHSDRFTSVVPLVPTDGDASAFASAMKKAGAKVWLFDNRDDSPRVVETGDSISNALREAEVELRHTRYPRFAHDAWNYAYRDPNLYRWLLQTHDGIPKGIGNAPKTIPDRKENGVAEFADPGASHPVFQQVLDRDANLIRRQIRWSERRDPAPEFWAMGAPDGKRSWLTIGEKRTAGFDHRRDDADSWDPVVATRHDFNHALRSKFPKEARPLGDYYLKRHLFADDQTEKTEAGAWARLTKSVSPRARIADIHLVAAAASLGSLTRPPLSAQPSRWKVNRDAVDKELTTFVEMIDEERYREYVFDRQGRLRTLMGHVPPVDDYGMFAERAKLPIHLGGTRLDIHYQPDGEPSGWTVHVSEGRNAPPRWFSRAEVLSPPEPIVSPGLGDRPQHASYWSRGAINLAGAEFAVEDADYSNLNPGQHGVDYTYPKRETIKHFSDAGVDLFRISVRWERLQKVLGGELREEELERLDSAIDTIAGFGGRAIIDLHNYGRYAQGFGGVTGSEFRRVLAIGEPVGSDTPVEIDDLCDFWRRMSRRYRDRPGIAAYGIMNEPHDMHYSDWLTISQAAVDAIREFDPHTWIIVAGDNWSTADRYPEDNGPVPWIDDPYSRIVYEAHAYLDEGRAGHYDRPFDEEFPTRESVDQRIAEVMPPFVNWCRENSVPGFIGEFGAPFVGDDWNGVVDEILQRADEADIGVCWWAAGPWWGDYPLSIQPSHLREPPRTASANDAAADWVVARLLQLGPREKEEP